MRQVLQNLKTGEIRVEDSPSPALSRGQVLIQTTRSLISAGTERMLVDFGKANLIQKALSQPEKVKQVLDKIRTDGLLPTADAVFKKLAEPLPLGYCNAGIVLDTGPGVEGFAKGDRIASNGPHAEIVAVPKNLCVRIPHEVPDEQAAFTVLASIALQGVRLLEPTLGERMVVYGLGLVGLIGIQLLRSSGCEVLGIDINQERLALAEKLGAKVVKGNCDPIEATAAWTVGRGVDGVLIAASAKTNDIVRYSAEMCRKRGRIVLVGVVGLDLRRADFYEKEISFQVSCSYGPGRYDENYEQKGQDYPIAYVRWTEQRNFEAVLNEMKTGRLQVEPLISHRIPFERADEAYKKVSEDSGALGVILEYPNRVSHASTVQVASARITPAGRVCVGVIGAGSFARATLVPALSKTNARIRWIASLDGASASVLARRFGAEQATSDYKKILEDPETNAVIIAVGHNLHANMACEALDAGKHVFVEKPLGLSIEDVADTISKAQAHPNRQLMVGFNRRFSSFTKKALQLLSGHCEPLAMTMNINAGAIPKDHWVHNPERGGGRIVGEACHFIDLMVYLAGSKVRTISSVMMGRGPSIREDKMSIVMAFEDGSVGTINYFANGNKAFPKEILEIFSEGRVLRLENFRLLHGFGFKGFKHQRTLFQDKGHAAELNAFVERVQKGGAQLIPTEDLVNVTLSSFAAVVSAREERTVFIKELETQVQQFQRQA